MTASKLSSKLALRAALVSAVSVHGLMAAGAMAQEVATSSGVEDIIVTAQRQAQSLQDVPIAVSAFSAESLQEQQINNASDLQLSLPNITFAKSNFTSSSFTIRGIGDLCVGVTCDSATGIHVNDMPLYNTRLFETEYFDLERVEVLRGPQGTLYGRNATAGVINFITAKPDLTGIKASGELEYGNYDSIRVKGMFNFPITETLGVRVAGFYLKRDGFTENLYDDSNIDGRDMYALRGSLRWEPTDNTVIDLMGYYFREDDDRLRIQKQLCQRDPSGVLGCLPGRLDYGVTNSNSTFVGVLSSRELLGINTAAFGPAVSGLFASLGLGSLYGPDSYANNVNPNDPRKVSTDYTPSYFTTEQQYQARVEHDFGAIKARASVLYQSSEVDSQQDYNLSVQNAAGFIPGLTNLQALASGGPLAGVLAPGAAALIPNGPNGPYCTSLSEETGTGLFGGNGLCSSTPQDFDRSVQRNTAWTGEAIISSQFDGKFNFLLGGTYADWRVSENSYYVNSFGIDYVSAVLGAANALGAQAQGNPAFPPVYLGSPFFRSNTRDFTLKSYGIFGEAYYTFNDKLSLTLGLRYNNDKKTVSARTTLLADTVSRQLLASGGGPLLDAVGRPIVVSATNSVLLPFNAGSIDDALNAPVLDFDPTRPGAQAFQDERVSFGRMTGRAVLDYKITDDNLVYVSYSRGYKSGGINPPLSPIFEVPVTFAPEQVDAFEIGSKNTFLDGTLRLNLTAFYYKYKGLQLSRIVARTSVNDNVDANIWGVEMDAIIQPTREISFNVGFSYLKTEVSSDKFLANPRDPSGGRGDAVIIKDITNGSNCAVVPTTAGNVAGTNGFVNFVNQNAFGLQPAAAFPSDSGLAPTTTGAFGICGALAAAAAGNVAAFNPALGALQPALNAIFNGGAAGPLPYYVESAGVPVNIKGNRLPQAPDFKFSIGGQYTAELDNGMTIVPRADLTFTGQSYGNIFNGAVNRIRAYEVVNAQIQVNGPENRWYVRGFVQNLFDNNATTGLYITDQSSGLFTNIFTLEPRRYGVAAGFNF